MNKTNIQRAIIIAEILMTGVVSAGGMNLNSIHQSDSCYIDGVWYTAGDVSTNKCFVCDPTVSQNSWTSRTDVCHIYGRCYEQEEQHHSGCAECDTSRNKTSWTVQSGKCVISDKCYDAGESHPLSAGSAFCDPDLSQASWTIPGDHCLINDNFMGDGMIHPAGYARCDVSVSKTAWTPLAGYNKIILAALNEAHTGNLGGITVADCLCNGQAAQAGEPGTWRAFLSGTTRNVRELIPDHLATGIEVGTIDGWPLYDNWTDMFTGLAWFHGTYIYTFNRTKVDEFLVSPNWYDARGWHGSNTDGTYRPGYNCQEWTSDSEFDQGACGELDQIWNSEWLSDFTCACHRTLAVVCILVDLNTPTDVNDDANNRILPDQFKLSQNYPNPFNPSTTIKFNLSRASDVKLEIFNIMGQKVAALVDDRKVAGEHSIRWDGKDDTGYKVASGIYFYRINAGDYVETKKMLLLK
jgi:hypothetical protein